MSWLFFIFIVLCPLDSRAMDYFSKPIDYWKGDQATRTAKPSPAKETPRPKKAKKFDWQTYSSPKNDEFFKEGDYTPPKPFMELARNPTDENIKRWFEMIETKNMLMENLQNRMAEYLQKSETKLTREEKSLFESKQVSSKAGAQEFKRFRFRLYFDSKCPHCQQMIKTAKELQDLGYYVEVRQIDKRQPEFLVPFPIVAATENELKERAITSWPVLFVADVSKQLIYRINGYFPTAEVLATLSKK